MRLLNEPKNEKYAVAHAAMISGDFVYINADGEAATPTDASTAATARFIAVKNPEYSCQYAGFSNVIATGDQVRLSNACRVEFSTPNLNLPTDNFATETVGAYLGITNSGKVAKVGSSAANTTTFMRFVSFVGNTTSGILVADVDFMI